MRIGHIVDIPPGEIQDGEYGTLAVVFRAKGENECYGFNNESYVHGWRHPEWKLGQGRFLAKIIVKTGGQVVTETVQIMNHERYEDFRLVSSDKKL